MLIREDDASETKVNMAIDDVASLKANMQKMRFSHRKQVRAVLNEAQLEKLETLREERGEFWKAKQEFQEQKQEQMFRKKRGKI
jgi:hypothetical protein